MSNFLICGLILIFYAYRKFVKTKILYPSIVFSIMWGLNCLYNVLILSGYVDGLFLQEYYEYKFISHYIVYFTGASLFAFWIAHLIKKRNTIKPKFDLTGLNALLKKYKWILWLNFFGGLLRILLIVATFGFDSVMNYRLAAEQMMYSGSGFIGLVFRITSYIQLLSNFYIAVCGIKAGMTQLKIKSLLVLFILYTPTQLATGGRLFILYFILFFFGAFVLGRGMKPKTDRSKFFLKSEIRTILISLAALLMLVPMIAISRYDEIDKEGQETAFDKFSYLTEGSLAAELCMQYHEKRGLPADDGALLFGGKSEPYMAFRGYLLQTKLGSVVSCMIIPLYLGYGYWGSLFVWFILAFLCEYYSLVCIQKLTLIRFFIFMSLLKFMYESILTGSLLSYYPIIELLILFKIFEKHLFGMVYKKTGTGLAKHY